jgi:hypothetical protein
MSRMLMVGVAVAPVLMAAVRSLFVLFQDLLQGVTSVAPLELKLCTRPQSQGHSCL